MMHVVWQVVLWVVVAFIVLGYIADFRPRRVNARSERRSRERIAAARESGELDEWIASAARRARRQRRRTARFEDLAAGIGLVMFVAGCVFCGYGVLFLLGVVG